MASYEHKEGSGALFPNDKQGNDARPDFRGDLMIGGVLYEVAGWVKSGNRGKFLSLSAKPKEQRQPARQSARGFDDDDPPF